MVRRDYVRMKEGESDLIQRKSRQSYWDSVTTDSCEQVAISEKNVIFYGGERMNAPIKNLMAAGTVSLIMAFVIMAALAQCASAATAIFQDGLDGYAGTEDNQILDPGTGFQDANVG